MNVLILGSGGREHTLAWKIRQSPLCDQLFIAPGNAGTALVGSNVDLKLLDFQSLADFALQNNIDCIIVGPEEPLVMGIEDFFRDYPEIFVLGPSQQGALLEGSKDFAKAFMADYNIPTAAYKTFVTGEHQEAVEFLNTLPPPYVLKADGLAAGKGVLICASLEEASSEIQAMLSGKFGKASSKVVIEHFLKGIEFSVFALTDGKDWVLLPEAKDYKRVGVGDTGPNTGGMGAVSPVPFADETVMQKVIERIVKPTIKGLHEKQIRYNGFVFFGLIMVNGDPFVIEYNCRMGDPETEVVIPRIEGDLLELILAVRHNKLNEIKVPQSKLNACTVMLCSGGYPDSYEKGFEMNIPAEPENTLFFHAGTSKKNDSIVTNGGRVLAVTTLSTDLQQGLENSKHWAEQIQFEGKYFRKDIGFDL
ncbi:MAG: phosphoribosylamine--glycine ligase [Saprospiraceae bacterium]|nr:phosphoribosylamine--glycine ligase [Saprospiraceae bacterium]